MAAIRQALTLVAGLALTKIIVDRTTDEPDTPDILPKTPDSPTKFVGLPDREEQIEEKLRGLP
tara:strand:- start:640 stop:828 length:189 start_codon:yes stop_codon:yes gene_type:complete